MSDPKQCGPKVGDTVLVPVVITACDGDNCDVETVEVRPETGQKTRLKKLHVDQLRALGHGADPAKAWPGTVSQQEKKDAEASKESRKPKTDPPSDPALDLSNEAKTLEFKMSK
jgi:hypothetical protein